MYCEKCGMPIKTVAVNLFNDNGSDGYYMHSIEECEQDAVYFKKNKSWTGYEMTEEEMVETIKCPKCKEFPFKNKEIQVYEIVRVVCFKDGRKCANCGRCNEETHGCGEYVNDCMKDYDAYSNWIPKDDIKEDF